MVGSTPARVAVYSFLGAFHQQHKASRGSLIDPVRVFMSHLLLPHWSHQYENYDGRCVLELVLSSSYGTGFYPSAKCK
jgi:hypothetical protein